MTPGEAYAGWLLLSWDERNRFLTMCKRSGILSTQECHSLHHAGGMHIARIKWNDIRKDDIRKDN